MLFRPEATAYRADRLSGDVAISVPIQWQVIGLFLFASLVAILILISTASFDRIETVVGVIIPDKGVSQILPSRSGVVTEIFVHEGQVVSEGAALAKIRVEEDAEGNVSSASQIEAAIARKDASLSMQIAATAASAMAEQGQITEQRGGLAAEIRELKSQLGFQLELVASAQRDFERTRAVAERGFVSSRDLQAREEALLARRQGMAQLEQSLVARKATLLQSDRTAAQMAAQSRAQAAGIAVARADAAQQAVNANSAKSYVLRAKVAGQVTTLTVRVGQPANAQSPLMTIIPSGSVLRGELSVSSVAIGFVRAGQEARLAIDAFPYQRFGTMKGKVLTVATSPITRPDANGKAVPVYPVTVALNQAGIFAFGRNEPLVSGMTLTARIVAEKQTLLQWLFEPLYAVRRR